MFFKKVKSKLGLGNSKVIKELNKKKIEELSKEIVALEEKYEKAKHEEPPDKIARYEKLRNIQIESDELIEKRMELECGHANN